jgi:ectoine hydroxylase-related dioxygenase (phytanoyl-CoA dioxygenase family)
MALECVEPFDPTQATVCPVPLGGASLHHARTLHGAGANVSAEPRYAYILAFRGPVRPDPSFRGYPWNQEKRTAAQNRKKTWENRGGPVGRASRRLLQRLRGR